MQLKQRAWWFYLVFGATATALYMVVPQNISKLVFWPLIGWSSVAAIVIGVRIHKPKCKAAWWFIAAGTALFIVGDNAYTFRSQIQHSNTASCAGRGTL